jgi:SAM-dependent methyltransferase
VTNKWDAKYSRADYLYGIEPNDFLAAHAALLPRGGAVLSLGEGEGRNAVFLAGLGHRVVALDQSAVGLAKAERLAASRGLHVETVVADLENHQLEAAAWSGIVSIWCHLPSAARRRLFGELASALQPGGVFLMESYAVAKLGRGAGGPSDPDLMPSLADLRRDLAGLEIIHGLETERLVAEGEGHRGMSAVVQVIARRT